MTTKDELLELMNSVAEKAVVAGNDSDGWNVEYFNHNSKCVLRAGCGDREDADELARLLNDASWIDVDAEGRL